MHCRVQADHSELRGQPVGAFAHRFCPFRVGRDAGEAEKLQEAFELGGISRV
jgi:hypothetical protein